MIRRPTTHLHNSINNCARPDPVTSISSNSISKETILSQHAIKKSDTFDSLNNRFESLDYHDHANTCTTSRHFRLHEGRRRRSHFGEDNSKETHKVSQREECVCVCVCVRMCVRKAILMIHSFMHAITANIFNTALSHRDPFPFQTEFWRLS